ncbi:RhoGEF domain-containing protein [Actinidia chinensis var. chinensis]|uniref:RhoGEF domain-containing protein n=1 Tax=Actinidia chinensis var. chinensis TaxID=1590841 RepID=A0A2R6QPA0_ACTCC|nr:RhoGEF domain-containing protein [Actinidia chinensis var. chinensis]
MACASMAMPLTCASQNRLKQTTSDHALFRPLSVRLQNKSVVVNYKPRARFEVQASLREKAITGLTTAALTASMVVPELAEAAVYPSLKNFLLSIAAGGVVLVVIVGAVIGVANFDPVKRS